MRRFFAGRTIEVFTWHAGPILEQNPHFRVLRVAPATPSDVWIYVSVGGWAATGVIQGWSSSSVRPPPRTVPWNS